MPNKIAATEEAKRDTAGGENDGDPIGSIRIVNSHLNELANATVASNNLRLNSPKLDTLHRATSALEQFKLKLPDESIANTRLPRPEPNSNETGRQIIATPSDFGQVLRDSRKAMGLTQQRFADLAGVGRRFVSECEAGKPRLEFGKVLQVAKAAGIDITAGRR